ncbi:MAG: helix-turn-helix domain-containing protein [Acetatifactor sp.]
MRKEKSYTQEELAIKLNVVRQTVSKWEKGLSVPDADVLSKIADALDTNVSSLLGGEVKQEDDRNEVAEQLAKISEQLAIKNRRSKRIWKIIGGANVKENTGHFIGSKGLYIIWGLNGI